MASSSGEPGIKLIKVPGIRVVGMHHWGGSQMALEVIYEAIREPKNPFDPCAIAIKDGGNTKAYVKKEDAKKLARVMDSDLISGTRKVYIKFHHPAEVRNKKTGPEQMGNVGFYCTDLSQASVLLTEVGLNFEVLK